MRASKPFTPPSPNYAVLACLLHRSFISIELDEKAANYYHRGKGHKDVGDSVYVPRGVDKAMEEVSTEPLRPPDYIYYGYDNETTEYSDTEEEDPTLAKRHDPQFLLFRRLLWSLFSDQDSYDQTCWTKSNRCYQFPYQILRQHYKLRDMIRREFRVPVTAEESKTEPIIAAHTSDDYFSSAFSVKTRRETAFLALRSLNEKLSWADHLQQQSTQQQKKKDIKSIVHNAVAGASKNISRKDINDDRPSPKQAAKYVEPMHVPKQRLSGSENDIPGMLAPGTFLVAHPLMEGYFQRSVICILKYGKDRSGVSNKNDKTEEHFTDADSAEDGDDDDDDDDFGAYGVIVNRGSMSETRNGKNRTLQDIVSTLPKPLVGVFGNTPVKDGGPVHMPSIQMLCAYYSNMGSTDGGGRGGSNADEDPIQKIGGTKLPPLKTTAGGITTEEKTVSFQGDILEAANLVETGQLDRGMFNSFFIFAEKEYFVTGAEHQFLVVREQAMLLAKKIVTV